MSILSFKDSGTADIYYGRNTKDARQTLPSELHRATCRRLDILDEAVELRACFRWTGSDAESVYIDDYH